MECAPVPGTAHVKQHPRTKHNELKVRSRVGSDDDVECRGQGTLTLAVSSCSSIVSLLEAFTTAARDRELTTVNLQPFIFFLIRASWPVCVFRLDRGFKPDREFCGTLVRMRPNTGIARFLTLGRRGSVLGSRKGAFVRSPTH